MNKKELVNAIAVKNNSSIKDAQRGLDTTLHIIRETLKKGGNVALAGFGSFTVATRKARKGSHPQTKKAIKIPSKKVPKFKAGKALREIVK